MRSSIIAAAALSFCISASAMAKDLDAIDLFAGDFAGVASVDFDKLAANKMISEQLDKNSAAEAADIINDLKAVGIDYKKDIDTLAVAVNDKGHVCAAVDGKKPLKDAFAALVKKDELTGTEYKGMMIYANTKGKHYTTSVLLSDKRILACEKDIDIKPIIDNIKSDSPKTLKDREPAIHKAYQLTDAKADIRVAGKMTPSLKSMVKAYSIDDGNGNSIGVADAENAAVSINFSKGLDIAVYAGTASADKSQKGAAIISAQLLGVLSDPSLNELGLGFVKDAVKVTSDKKNIKLTVKLSDAQLATITALVLGLADTAAPAVTSSSTKKAEPAKKAAPVKKAEPAKAEPAKK